MRVEFGRFVLDIDRHQLRTGGVEVHLSPKAFQLLTTLVERRPAVLSKSELHEALWPDVFVSDSRLGGVVVELRHALGERAHSPSRFIRTVHGVGYAFEGAATVHEGPERRAVEPVSCWLALGDTGFALHSGENVLGRDPACDVPLESSSVSRRHARITVLGAEATIEDLHSKNGTFIGDRRVKSRCRLSNGDIVWLGSLALTYCRNSAQPAMSTKTAAPPVRARKSTA